MAADTPHTLTTVRFVGSKIARPECVLAHASGLLFAPDWSEAGGVAAVRPDGSVGRIQATGPGPGVETPIRPNGIALEPGGTFLIAHLGDTQGGIYRLHADGACDLVTDTVDGAPMPPANFVLPDGNGGLWITVSTRVRPRADDYRATAKSGFIAHHKDGVTRLAADGLGYTNECLLSEDGRTLWVNETFVRRLSAFTVTGDRLSERREVARFGEGVFPDGLAQEADGALLITSIISNRVIRVHPDGRQEVALEDADAAHVAWVEAAYRANALGRPHLDQNPSQTLRNVSNLAFGGPDLRTAYLGCLLGDRIAAVDWPVAGRPLPHWDADLGPLAALLGG